MLSFGVGTYIEHMLIVLCYVTLMETAWIFFVYLFYYEIYTLGLGLMLVQRSLCPVSWM